MGNWTPGPWEYHAAGNYHGYSIAPVGTLPTLAAVERPVGGTTLNVTAFNFPGETEANARLIAAAPDLLDALKDTLCALEVCGRDFGYVADKARAAIAAATGDK